MNNLICQCQIDKQKDQNPFGLYYISELNQRNLVKLPIEKVEFNVEIINNISKVQIIQSYHNFSTIPLSAQYLFPISSDSCFHSFKAEFNNEILSGIIKEKEEAKKEFNAHKEKGNTIALQQISEDSPDIMKIDIANIQANSTVKICIEFIEELQITMNQFYTFKILSILTPRYCNSEKMVDFPEYNIVPNINHKPCVTTLNIQLNTTSPIELLKSPSHDDSLQITNQNADKTQTNLQINNILFQNDFVLLFKDENINKPSVILGSTDTQVCAQLNFIPNFNNLQTDDAYKQYLKDEKVFEVDMNYCQSEFIFLLDRSYSMSGSRIEQAKSALKIFIKSLPKGSYYNIISFGSQFKHLYQKSIEYTQETQEETLKKIEEFDADFGGTQILYPIKAILQQQPIQNMPRQIFLLTDGEISSPKEVIYHIKENLHNSRLHTIGIGSGCSEYCIKQTAKAGKGKHIFINDNDSMNNNIINLLESALSPYINEFTLQYDKNLIEEITPNPEKVKCILKNEQITFYILFKPNLTLQKINTIVSLSYFDNRAKTTLHYNLPVQKDSPQDPNVYKLAIYNQIKSLQNQIDNEQFLQNQAKPTQETQKKLINLSLNNQILSTQTAFLCLIKSLNDQEHQQFKDQQKYLPSTIIQPFKENQDEFDYLNTPFYGLPGRNSTPVYTANRSYRHQCTTYYSPSYDPKYLRKRCSRSRSRSPNREKESNQRQLRKCKLKKLKPDYSPKRDQLKSINSPLLTIISQQQFDGNWYFNEENLKILGISSQEFSDSIPQSLLLLLQKEKDKIESVWMTLLICCKLGQNFKEERDTWSLIQKKALTWLKTEFNIELDQFRQYVPVLH